MPNGVIEPIWVKAAQRFRNAVTGQWISFVTSAPYLKWTGGAVRDIVGHFIPYRFYGGKVIKTHALARGLYYGAIREVPKVPEGFIPRKREMYGCTVSYTVFGEYREPVPVNIKTGQVVDYSHLQGLIARRITGAERDGLTWEEMPAGVEIVGIEYHFTTYYDQGETIAGEPEIWRRRLAIWEA